MNMAKQSLIFTVLALWFLTQRMLIMMSLYFFTVGSRYEVTKHNSAFRVKVQLGLHVKLISFGRILQVL